MGSFNVLQTIATFRTVAIAIGGIAIGFGFATQEQVAALTDPALWTGISGAIVAGIGIYTAVKSRGTTKMAAATGDLLKGRGAVIAPASIADNSATPPNVVSSVSEASRLPGMS